MSLMLDSAPEKHYQFEPYLPKSHILHNVHVLFFFFLNVNRGIRLLKSSLFSNMDVVFPQSGGGKHCRWTWKSDPLSVFDKAT